MNEKNKIEFIYQCNKSVLNWLGKQSLDFYLPKYNIAIECQGGGHFLPIKAFGGNETLLDENKLLEKILKYAET